MTTFTKTQMQAIMATTNATGTVEEYAAQMGFTIAAEAAVVVAAAAKATRSARPVGKTSVVVVYSETTGTALLTTNTGFAGRTADWIIADWKKTVAGSRPEVFRTLMGASDVVVSISELQDFVTDADRANVLYAAGLTVAHFEAAGYTFISKLARGVRAVADANATTMEHSTVNNAGYADDAIEAEYTEVGASAALTATGTALALA